jgi:hypothetical protein
VGFRVSGYLDLLDCRCGDCDGPPMSSQYHERNDNDRRKAWATLKWFPERLTDADRALLLLDEPDFCHPVDAQRHMYDERGFAK